jgi:hypothetical protein
VKPVDDDTIRTTVRRLARPHPSGGEAIERSVILAEGSDSAAIIAWVLSHAGVPDSTATMAARRGIHGPREQRGVETPDRPPLRFLLPAGSLD